jgi:hypothetical protein
MRFPFTKLLLVASAALCYAATPAAGSEVAGAGPAIQQPCEVDIWMVSTRRLDCCDTKPEQSPSYEVLHFDEQNGWNHAGLLELLATDDAVTTVIYVHGNRVEMNEISERSWGVYRGLQSANCHDRLRLVIWSWPSDQIRGPLQDVRSKAKRTLCEGYYLASFLGHYEPRHRIGLIGYSFGARIVASALHGLRGGTINDQAVPFRTQLLPSQVRVALLAAAIDEHALMPEGAWGLAWQALDQLLVSFNPRDPVLKRFRFVDRATNPRALGFVGMPGMIGDGSRNVEQFNVSGCVGRTHDESTYFGSPALMDVVAPFVLGRR